MASESVLPEDWFLDLLKRLHRLGPEQPPFEEVQITPSQLVLLDWVAASPGCRLQQICAGLGVTAPTVSVGIRKLEELGMLERQPDPDDGRSLLVSLTLKGQTLYERAQDFRRYKARLLLAGLTVRDQQTMLNLLEQAISSAEERLNRESI
jgi:DNA-binding MarR family transcriptional regulator